MYGKIALEGQLTTGQDVQMELTPLNDQLDVSFLVLKYRIITNLMLSRGQVLLWRNALLLLTQLSSRTSNHR